MACDPGHPGTSLPSESLGAQPGSRQVSARLASLEEQSCGPQDTLHLCPIPGDPQPAALSPATSWDLLPVCRVQPLLRTAARLLSEAWPDAEGAGLPSREDEEAAAWLVCGPSSLGSCRRAASLLAGQRPECLSLLAQHLKHLPRPAGWLPAREALALPFAHPSTEGSLWSRHGPSLGPSLLLPLPFWGRNWRRGAA